MKKLILGLALLSLSSLSQALVVNFDAENTQNFTNLSTQGFDFQASGTGYVHVSSGGSSYCGPPCVYNGTNHLLAWLGGSFEMTASNGGSFDFFGFDGGETHMDRQSQWATSIRLTGTKSGGAIVQEDFVLDHINDGEGPLNDFQTFFPNSDFTDLISLNFEGIGGDEWFTVDNLVVNDVPVSAPATLLLFGLGLFGLARIRKNQA